MKETKRKEVVIKAINEYNKSNGYEKISFSRSLWRGERGTHEYFEIVVDGVKDNFYPSCKVSIKQHLELLNMFYK